MRVFGQLSLPTSWGLALQTRVAGVAVAEHACVRRLTLRTERCGDAHGPPPPRCGETEARAVTSFARARHSEVARGASDLGRPRAPCRPHGLKAGDGAGDACGGLGLGHQSGGGAATLWGGPGCTALPEASTGDTTGSRSARREGPGRPSSVTRGRHTGSPRGQRLRQADPSSSRSPVSQELHPTKLSGRWG